MDLWENAFRVGFCPSFSEAGLQALARAIDDDDPRLVQGSTTIPPPIQTCATHKIEAACAVTFCGWQDPALVEQITNVEQAHDYFASTCQEADARLGMPAVCRHFLNWFDGPDGGLYLVPDHAPTWAQIKRELRRSIGEELVARASHFSEVNTREVEATDEQQQQSQ